MASNELAKMLLARWQSGDQAAAEAIYQRYAQRLCAIAEKDIGERLARRVGPEDIVQSVFRTFFRRSGDGQFAIDHSGALWRLLVRITANKVLRHAEREGAARRDMKAEVHAGDDGLEPALICHDPTPAEAAALADELQAVISGLEPPEPEMLRLCLEGFATTEIAEQLGVSRWTVRRVLDRIGHDLERRLKGDSNR